MTPTDALRERVLEAAAILVQEGAAERLTLEDVGAAADVAQAEMAALFPDLPSLINAVAERGYLRMKAMIAEAIGEDEEPGSYLRGYIASAFPSPSDEAAFAWLMRTLLMSAPLDYDGLEPVRSLHTDEDVAIVADGLDPVLARIVRLAVDGLYLNDVFGLSALSKTDRAAVVERLALMTQRAAPAPV